LNGPRGGRLRRLHQRLKELLEPRLREIGFQGAIGIDAFAYRDPEGGLRLKPVVEINPRYTMGRLMLELRRHVANGSSARLELVGLPAIKKAGSDSFLDHAAKLQAQEPLVLAGSPKPLIRSGVVCLTDPARTQGCLAVLRVTAPLSGQ
jgi:hypothetical protein